MTIAPRGYDAVPAGASLVAVALGDADAPAVLMLHGEGQSRAMWAEAVTALAEAGRYVIALDLRGHGESRAASEGAADLDAHVADVRGVLETLGSRPVVVGSGLGAQVALATLGEGGEHLATGLVLLDEDEGDAPMRTRLDAAATRIKVPTLVIDGPCHDIAGARKAAISEGGPLVAADRADAFNALLLEFLEQAAPRAVPEYRAGSDPRTLRDALGCFGTGVTVVTTIDAEGKPVGLTANSFTAVSLDPPLLLVCLANTVQSLPAFAAAKGFAVNVLHTGQQTVSGRFASRHEDRFAATPWETWDTGAPIIEHSLASFDCTKFAWHEAGDHVILVGHVQRVRFEPRRDPLLYFRGRYRRLHFS
jgi:flavin reductase (DIM6/NTAB) family NADH-FMN oxidoreductase RutF/dienelactone hydrolase